jgi:hypothetical protein
MKAPSSRAPHRAAGAAAFSLIAALAAALVFVWAATPAAAQAGSAAVLYREADLPAGEKLVREHRCDECHIRRVGGNGSAIYRPQGRINTPAALRGMVENCNLELNLALFPDEVTSIAAVLNRDHYRFK